MFLSEVSLSEGDILLEEVEFRCPKGDRQLEKPLLTKRVKQSGEIGGHSSFGVPLLSEDLPPFLRRTSPI